MTYPFAEVFIQLLSSEQGGRTAALDLCNDRPGEYRPHLRVIDGSGKMLGVAFVDGPDEPVQPGGQTYATIEFLYRASDFVRGAHRRGDVRDPRGFAGRRARRGDSALKPTEISVPTTSPRPAGLRRRRGGRSSPLPPAGRYFAWLAAASASRGASRSVRRRAASLHAISMPHPLALAIIERLPVVFVHRERAVRARVDDERQQVRRRARRRTA